MSQRQAVIVLEFTETAGLVLAAGKPPTFKPQQKDS